jgi:hypothetical protein
MGEFCMAVLEWTISRQGGNPQNQASMQVIAANQTAS